ncbi:PsbP domain-containing protein 2, chloroplastic [Turnera subulata]|uniref:PsbP domain-containing protein 2, chloroplastic n=1 Tax=Turnera subulata TaxID=218843 RepID=A0A9Q0JBD5_9ROSI|nr:PsbP domain-containing protein 2, chloroplastic [Turnera subulata]
MWTTTTYPGNIMALRVCSSLPHQQCQITKPFSPKPFLSLPIPKVSVFTHKPNSQNIHKRAPPPFCSGKRRLNLSILALIINGSLPNMYITTLAAPEMEFQRYTDPKEGFALLIPSSYVKVDKAGATVLFEEANNGSNNVGVVVNPVRLSSLGEFGTPEFVAQKLIQAEKRKESTKDAEVIGVSERSANGGVQVYEFEYKVDSTRGGMKRIFSAAFVASKKLYLLNISHADKPENPLDAQTRKTLEEVLHSFDTAPMT